MSLWFSLHQLDKGKGELFRVEKILKITLIHHVDHLAWDIKPCLYSHFTMRNIFFGMKVSAWITGQNLGISELMNQMSPEASLTQSLSVMKGITYSSHLISDDMVSSYSFATKFLFCDRQIHKELFGMVQVLHFILQILHAFFFCWELIQT